jgi:hypothetical protein
LQIELVEVGKELVLKCSCHRFRPGGTVQIPGQRSRPIEGAKVN